MMSLARAADGSVALIRPSKPSATRRGMRPAPATPTSVVEEDRLYVSFGSQGLACLDRETGDKVWERRDLRIYQPVRQGSSPIVDGKNLYVAFDGTEQQFFVALGHAL